MVEPRTFLDPDPNPLRSRNGNWVFDGSKQSESPPPESDKGCRCRSSDKIATTAARNFLLWSFFFTAKRERRAVWRGERRHVDCQVSEFGNLNQRIIPNQNKFKTNSSQYSSEPRQTSLETRLLSKWEKNIKQYNPWGHVLSLFIFRNFYQCIFQNTYIVKYV